MQLLPLIAEVGPFRSTEDAITWFAIATVVFLLLCGGVLRWGGTAATKLIALGILAAVLSVAYGGFSPPTLLPVSAALAKIAVILVLGGVACSVIAFLGGVGAAETAKPKEASHDL